MFLDYMRDEQRIFSSSRTEDFGTKGKRERDPFNGMKDKLNSNYDLPGSRPSKGAPALPSSSNPQSKKRCIIHPTGSHSIWECQSLTKCKDKNEFYTTLKKHNLCKLCLKVNTQSWDSHRSSCTKNNSKFACKLCPKPEFNSRVCPLHQMKVKAPGSTKTRPARSPSPGPSKTARSPSPGRGRGGQRGRGGPRGRASRGRGAGSSRPPPAGLGRETQRTLKKVNDKFFQLNAEELWVEVKKEEVPASLWHLREFNNSLGSNVLKNSMTVEFLPMKDNEGGCTLIKTLYDSGSSRCWCCSSVAASIGFDHFRLDADVILSSYGGEATITHGCWIKVENAEGKLLTIMALICDNLKSYYAETFFSIPQTWLDYFRVKASHFSCPGGDVTLILGADATCAWHPELRSDSNGEVWKDRELGLTFERSQITGRILAVGAQNELKHKQLQDENDGGGEDEGVSIEDQQDMDYCNRLESSLWEHHHHTQFEENITSHRTPYQPEDKTTNKDVQIPELEIKQAGFKCTDNSPRK